MISIKPTITGNTKKFIDGRYKAIYKSELMKAMTESLTLLETEVAKNTPVNYGTLRAGVRGIAQSHLRGQVGVEGAAAKYADIVERGRRPGKWPPTAPIKLWVKRQIRPEPNKLNSITFLVQRKIGKMGTKGRFMFRNAERKLKRRVINRFKSAFNNIERKLSG